MLEIAKRTFTNKHNDIVLIRLLEHETVKEQYSLIVDQQLTRNTVEKRFNGRITVALPVTTITHERQTIEIHSKSMAENEFNLYRVLHCDPAYSMEQYTAWQKEQENND